MNEFTVKKLAEVQAFSILGGIIADRAGVPFSNETNGAVAILQQAARHDFGPRVPARYSGLFTTKTDKTVSKLTVMMELYIGDQWDNPVEVLEWSSFYSGAAAAHSALAAEAIKTTDVELHAELARLAEVYQDLLVQVMANLRNAAASRR